MLFLHFCILDKKYSVCCLLENSDLKLYSPVSYPKFIVVSRTLSDLVLRCQSVQIPASVKVNDRLLKRKKLKGYIKAPRGQRGSKEINFPVQHNFYTKVVRKPVSCTVYLVILFGNMSDPMIL